MCGLIPKAPKVPVMPERQAMQVPQDPQGRSTSLNNRRRRGMWASIFTSPRGLTGAPTVTGTSGGGLGA